MAISPRPICLREPVRRRFPRSFQILRPISRRFVADDIEESSCLRWTSTTVQGVLRERRSLDRRTLFRTHNGYFTGTTTANERRRYLSFTDKAGKSVPCGLATSTQTPYIKSNGIAPIKQVSREKVNSIILLRLPSVTEIKSRKM